MKASVVFWGSRERRQLVKHNILGKLPTIFGETPLW